MSRMVASERNASLHRLEREVERLSERQSEAMRMARFAGMTLREVKEYGARHRRIIHMLKEMAMIDNQRS